MRVAIQMDPLESINPHSDSTLLLGLEAQRRGHKLWVYTPDKLSLLNGEVVARAHAVTLYEDFTRYYEKKKEELLPLARMDVVLLRQDPPFDMQYITTTYLLEKLLPKTKVVNHPAYVRNHPEKLFPTLFNKFVPPTLISADPQAIEEFCKEHKDIVIKPLYGFGGHSIFRFRKDDANMPSFLEMVFSQSRESWVVQPFLPEVKDGERRLMLIDGKLKATMARLPAAGDIRANLRVGGTAAKAKASKRQQEVCEALGPELKKKGLIFAGVDMIGDYLIEVNITCPTGLAAIRKLYNQSLERDIWGVIEKEL